MALLHAELLLQARRGRRVLEHQLLVRIHVLWACCAISAHLVKAGQDELQLARIGVDVADGEDAVLARLELLGITGNEVLMEIQAPVGDGPELHGQPEERQHGRRPAARRWRRPRPSPYRRVRRPRPCSAVTWPSLKVISPISTSASIFCTEAARAEIVAAVQQSQRLGDRLQVQGPIER